MSDTINLTEMKDSFSVNFAASIERLTEAILERNFKDSVKLFRDIAPEVGLKHIAHLRFVAGKCSDVTLLTAVVTYSKEWQTRYFLKRYQDIDPVVSHGVNALQPFDWQTLLEEAPHSIGFFADAQLYNVGRCGVTFPIRNRRNGFSLVSFSSDLDHAQWREFKYKHMSNMKTLAILIDSAADINCPLGSNGTKLSKREEECLTWAARGKTHNEIAEIIGTTYGSVKSYLDLAKSKLNCINVTHAVAVAVAIGLIPSQALKGSDPAGFCEPETALPKVAV